MKNTHLIQRLQKPYRKTNPFSFGDGYVNGGLSDKAADMLSGIFSFDYMGAAEFEFGAVPKALQTIAKNAEKGNLVTGTVENVFYLCPSEFKDGVENTVRQLLKDEYQLRLHEHCGLKGYFDKNNKYGKNNLGWLELDNGYFFFVDEKMFKDTCKLFGVES